MNLGMTELIVIFGIVILLFGGKKLPGLGKALGDSIRGFKEGLSGDETPAERQARLPQDKNQNLLNSKNGDQNADVTQTTSEKDKTRG